MGSPAVLVMETDFIRSCLEGVIDTGELEYPCIPALVEAFSVLGADRIDELMSGFVERALEAQERRVGENASLRDLGAALMVIEMCFLTRGPSQELLESVDRNLESIPSLFGQLKRLHELYRLECMKFYVAVLTTQDMSLLDNFVQYLAYLSTAFRSSGKLLPRALIEYYRKGGTSKFARNLIAASIDDSRERPNVGPRSVTKALRELSTRWAIHYLDDGASKPGHVSTGSEQGDGAEP